MAFTQTKAQVQIRVDDGTTTSGTQKLANVNFPNVNPSLNIQSSETAILAVVSAVTPILANEVASVRGIMTGNIAGE